jgi:hypothetical protein
MTSQDDIDLGQTAKLPIAVVTASSFKMELIEAQPGDPNLHSQSDEQV